MRVLLVNTYHFRGGGDSTYTFNLADLLRARGHTVAFFAMQDRRNLPDPNADLFVSHIDFKELNHSKTPANAMRVIWRSVYSVEARRKFAELLDRFQPDVVHLQSIHAHITPSVILEAKKCGLPVVWTLHDYKLICPNTHFLVNATDEICEACGSRAYYQPIIKRCKKNSLAASCVISLEAYAHRAMQVREKVDDFLAPSAFLRNKLVERGVPSEKVHHLPHFLPNEMFQVDQNNRRTGYLLFLGRLEPIKGIRPLLQACRTYPDITLILAGRSTEPLASELPTLLPSNAQYVGVKQGEELQQLLNRALAVVVPSLWYENQPFSILEAFAHAKPVIASSLGGMTELVKDGERGILVPPGDVQTLAGAMCWILAHPASAQEMGQLAQAYARQEHGVEGHYERIVRIYQQVLGRT